MSFCPQGFQQGILQPGLLLTEAFSRNYCSRDPVFPVDFSGMKRYSKSSLDKGV